MDNQAARQKREVPGSAHDDVKRCTRIDQQACLPRRLNDAIVWEGFVYEAQERILAPGTGVSQHIHLLGARTTLLRNNRVLIFLTFLGSIAALLISLGMVFVSLTNLFPLSAMNLDRFVPARCGYWARG